MTTEKSISREYAVKFHECRPDGKIHFYIMMRNLQEMAVAHADVLGCGADVLNKSGHYWVLSNIRLAAHNLPAYSEAFIIKTWPSGKNRLIAEREFIVSEPDGKKLLVATSEWLIMNTKNRRPVKLTGLDLDIPESDQKVFGDGIKRLKPVSSGKPILQFPVLHSSLDANGHVNNTEYVRWAIDALHLSSGTAPCIKTLQMTYLSEVFEKNEVQLAVTGNPAEGVCGIMGKNISTGKPAFISKVTLNDV
jgi:medium-chain acyl-[acyl-carrier-protein] hydrolase